MGKGNRIKRGKKGNPKIAFCGCSFIYEDSDL